MPSQEFDEARRLLDELESRWISLLLWLSSQSGLSHDDLVAKLGNTGLDALNNYQRRQARTPSATFTPLHFLPFSGYVEVAAAHRDQLAALGAPPANWRQRLQQQNLKAVTYRNDLQHAQRFDDLSVHDRREAVAIFGEQLQSLTAWWPDHPYQQREARIEEGSPLRSAVQLLSRDAASALELARQLGFTPVSNALNLIPPGSPSPLAATLGDEFGSLYEVGRKPLANNGQALLFLALLNHWPEQAAARERYRRRLARALVNASPNSRFLILLVDNNLQPDGSDQVREVEIVYPRQRANRPIATVRAVIDLARPTRYQMELLGELNIAADTSLKDIARRWNQAFDIERVTTRFYNEFHALRDRLADALIEHNPTHPELINWRVADLSDNNASGEKKQFQLNVTSFATRQLSRLLFLWFLQQKGWLGTEILPGSSTFLVDLYRGRPKGGDTYFSEVLVPLFFDGVGRPPEDPRHRETMARLGGSVPYLDGGLFRADADAFERALFGVDAGDNRTLTIMLPDALFDPATDNPDALPGRGRPERQRTILGLLRGYRFTTQESTPDDQSVDPDPELLGKVFENLYQQDDRRQTGAYYTPREVVRYLCRQPLDGYLLAQTGEHGVSQATLDRLRDEAIDWESTDVQLTAVQERVLTDALRDVTVIDPAVGSGAFLVGMLQEITLLRRGIRSAAIDAQIERGSEDVYDWKRHAVTRSLHGVDVNPTAVEICRLRLWLSLVIEYNLTRQRDIPALPNLEFRVVAGDSLVDRVGATPFRQSLPTSYVQPDFEMTQTLERLDRAIARYREADQEGRARRVSELGQEIRELQRSVVSTQLERTIVDARFRLKTLQKAARPSQRPIAAIAGELLALEQMLATQQAAAPVLKPLLWPLVFREVFERGGFDLAVANPPYVRQESISPVDQRAYEAAFDPFYAGTADLYVSFFARALQIVRDGGWLSFITSNKYMRAGYGERARQTLTARTRIAEVIDFGDLPVFAAAAYPALLIAQKLQPTPDQPESDAEPEHLIVAADLNLPVRRRLRADDLAVNVDNVRAELDDLPALITEARAANYPQALLRPRGWILEDPVLVRLFDRLMSEGTPLGQYVNGRMYYGIKTGLNEAFVINQATRDALIAADPRSAEVIKPWLRGRDIKRWRPEWAGLYVIALQNSGDRDATNPWGTAANEPAARRPPHLCRHLPRDPRAPEPI